MRDASNLHSFDVCNITQKIETISQEVAIEKVNICDHYKQLEVQKDELLLEGKAKYAELLLEKERCMDVKRDLEFELLLIEERKGRAVQREEVRLEDMRHKIEVQKLHQEKIKQESKENIIQIFQLSNFGANGESKTGNTIC